MYKLNFILFFLLSVAMYSQEVAIESHFLQETRTVKVSLPRNYQQSNINYPVIYVFDGQVLFDYVVGLHTYNSDIYPECIVVGIFQKERSKELVKLDKDSRKKLFKQFFNKELIPKINSDYRTLDVSIFMGHSFGGAFVLHEFFNSENNFAISISPSFPKNEYLDLMQKVTPKKDFQKIYVAYGTNESVYFKNASNQLTKDLTNIPLKLEEFKDEDHNSSVLIGFRKGFDYIFKNWFLNFPEDNWDSIEKEKNPNLFYAYYQNLSDKIQQEVNPSEEDLNTLGYYYVGQKKYKKALEIFTKNINRHPYSQNTYDSLAETYLAINDVKQSIHFYEEAINAEKRTENRNWLIEDIKRKIKEIKNRKKE